MIWFLGRPGLNRGKDFDHLVWIMVCIMHLSMLRGSPIPLLKTVSRISNRPFHASRKMQKHLHVHRKKQAITFHVKMLRLNHIRQEKQRQACMDSRCGFCDCVALSKPFKLLFCSYEHVFWRFPTFVRYDRRLIKKKNLIHQNTIKPRAWKRYIKWRFLPLGL